MALGWVQAAVNGHVLNGLPPPKEAMAQHAGRVRNSLEMQKELSV